MASRSEELRDEVLRLLAVLRVAHGDKPCACEDCHEWHKQAESRSLGVLPALRLLWERLTARAARRGDGATEVAASFAGILAEAVCGVLALVDAQLAGQAELLVQQDVRMRRLEELAHWRPRSPGDVSPYEAVAEEKREELRRRGWTSVYDAGMQQMLWRTPKLRPEARPITCTEGEAFYWLMCEVAREGGRPPEGA